MASCTERNLRFCLRRPNVAISVLAIAVCGLLGRAESAAAQDVVVGAGDIADCARTQDQATAALLDGIPGTVIALGDLAYQSGTAAEFANCYGPTWGRHRARTRPSPGNHEYLSSGAAPYYAYFGAAAGPAGRGYYSFNLGNWHIVSLNSNVAAGAGSAQDQWLRADLADPANQKPCTLAYWHHALFSSGSGHGNDFRTMGLFQTLYNAGADVVLTGHDHNYERSRRRTPRASRTRPASGCSSSGPGAPLCDRSARCSPTARCATPRAMACSG